MMSRAAFFAGLPPLAGLGFALWVLSTRDGWANEADMVQIVVMGELSLMLLGVLLVLAQLPFVVYALVKNRPMLAGGATLGVITWIVLFLIGMGLGPALVWVT